MEPIHKKVGRNLQAIRKSRGLSLDNVAELTGVSKAMLGQIERGDSNPTISVLWRIVSGLGISFTTLIEESETEVTVVSPDEVEPFHEAEGAYRVYPLFSYNLRTKFESYMVVMDPGCDHGSEAHNDGVEEYIFVHEGELELWREDESYTVPAGNSVHFSANRPHRYRNPGKKTTKFYTIIFYADAAARR
ncbi:transcriptional regulator, XRE family with cupin sensor [Paenibacillus uliginis N3/975]|uniref:Transcriptional regulator, XRE family with cupin sensor n=1 Tax=Paenibacillus uliginis N3/975 TaxID=1313296 RepID=A0A1X7HRH5_9BACL|nr:MULTISPECIES: XRE family transcriptional regulator [Paenibacillus]UNK19326.1 XRE family transcriptional regulator [Paenibacillus sp. N3/727]SMF90536.1 transcriptional regulator, XRE family with cupin sensor [Paenibacillus uliginis N3/975]